ncbi:TRAP transporter small permease subunit [Actinomyces sp. B33]|uniref:TRAP transporter small permease n=1 Tax=Actinomyces sp. B33 TaxID=2942131 RepID=UPI002340ADB0|nr:TRAP transporter small permease subunit [Actinomyces sp. B33]MDC4233337.1 TRAP transporter small permease subunit [Actinomyces sp. B33]
MSDTTPHGAVITEDDIAALDTQSVLDEPLEATDPINQWFLRVGSWFACALTIVMILLVTVAVAMRYIFNSSIDLASEAPSYLLPWLIAAGAVVAQAQMAHVGVNFFLEKFQGKAYQRIATGIWVFVAVLMAYMTYLGIYMAGPMSQQETPIMGWPQLGSFAAFIVMTTCLCIQSIVRAWYFHKDGAIRSIEVTYDQAAAENIKEAHDA